MAQKKQFIVPKGHSIDIRGRQFRAGDLIPKELTKFAPKDWEKSIKSEEDDKADQDKQ